MTLDVTVDGGLAQYPPDQETPTTWKLNQS